jgi:hypothetical protein
VALLVLHELRDNLGSILLLHCAVKPSMRDASLSQSNFTHCAAVILLAVSSHTDSDLQSKVALNNAKTTAFSTLRGLAPWKSSSLSPSALQRADTFSFDCCHKKCQGVVVPREYLSTLKNKKANKGRMPGLLGKSHELVNESLQLGRLGNVFW